MTKVLILGANGQLARNTTRFFLEHSDVRLTLYLRRANRLRNPDPSRVAIIEGDVTDRKALKAARQGQDAVYANLSGAMKHQAEAIVGSMHATGLKRLIFISSMGIYGEVQGERYRSVLDPYRDSASVIEASDPGSAVYSATKHAVRALSEGLRQEVKPYNIRTTVISPGVVATELPNSVTDPAVSGRIHKLYEEIAIPAESFARAVAFAISQPDDVDINEILFRPTRQEY